MRVRVTLKENFHSLVNSCASCLKVIRRIGHNKKKKYLVEITRGVVQIFVISRRLSLRIRGIASLLRLCNDAPDATQGRHCRIYRQWNIIFHLLSFLLLLFPLPCRRILIAKGGKENVDRGKILSQRNSEIRFDPLRENGDRRWKNTRWFIEIAKSLNVAIRAEKRNIIRIAIGIGMMERECAPEMRENSSQIDGRGCVS